MAKITLKAAPTYSILLKNIDDVGRYTATFMDKLIENSRPSIINQFIADYTVYNFSVKITEEKYKKIIDICERRKLNYVDFVELAVLLGAKHFKDIINVKVDKYNTINRPFRMVLMINRILKPLYRYLESDSSQLSSLIFVSKSVVWLMEHESELDKINIDKSKKIVAEVNKKNINTNAYDAYHKLIEKSNDIHHSRSKLIYDMMYCKALDKIVTYSANVLDEEDRRIKLLKEQNDVSDNEFKVEKKVEIIEIKGDDFMENTYDPTLKEFGEQWVSNNPKIADKYCNTEEISVMKKLLKSITLGKISLKSLNEFIENHQF